MDTKGKNSGEFYHSIGIITLTKTVICPRWWLVYPHKNVNCKRKKKQKRKDYNNNSIY
jgi:hypothetical protein